MHICILPAWYYDLEGIGGGGFFREQALALQASGVKIDLYYPILGHQYRSKPTSKWINDDGLAVFKYQHFSLPRRNQLLLWYWKKLILQGFELYLKKHSKLPDIIHAHSLWGAYAALQIHKKYSTPFVYTEHLGKWTKDDFVLPNRYKNVLAQVVEEATVVSAVSNGLANKIKKWTGRQSVVTTPNLVDTHFFHPSADEQTVETTFQLISIGDPWQVKGLDILIEAIGIAQTKVEKEIHLTLIDKIPKRADLYPIIKQYELEGQVHFVGFLSRTNVRAALQTHHCLVSASRHESFGLSMVEAMACGIPVIATKTSGALDIITDGMGYLIEREQPEALAQAILEMMDEHKTFNPSTLKNYAESTFGATTFTQKWLSNYKNISLSNNKIDV